MRYKVLVASSLFFLLILYLPGIQLKKTDEWKHDELMTGMIQNSLIDSDGNLIVMFQKSGIRIVNKLSNNNYFPKGQGPGDILSWMTICWCNDSLAEIEMYRKIQIFEKRGSKYKWKKNIWREEKNCLQFVHTALFLDNRWIMGGTVIRNESGVKKAKESILSPYFIRILDKKGKFLKELISVKKNKFVRTYFFDCFLDYDKKFIYFMIEDDLSLYKITRSDLSIKNKSNLKKPKFYKTMPNDFYLFETKMRHNMSAQLKFQSWKTGYSAVTKMVITDDYLLVQIRTADDILKNFALLFYDKKTLELKDILFTNDMLLVNKDDKLYFFKDGGPYIDDDAGVFVVKVFTLKKDEK